MKKFLLAGLFCIALAARAQTPILDWAGRAGGAGDDEAVAMAMDASGNTYTVGIFSETVDFDFGSGTSSLTAQGFYDVFITKMDASGHVVWARNVGGPGLAVGFAIAVDGSGNVIVSGGMKDTIDFDPGPGVHNLVSAGDDDIFLLKLDASGNFMWAKSMGAAELDQGSNLATDAAGNIYLMGGFKLTVDFDPGPGISTMTSNGGVDAYLAKFDAAGKFAWAIQQGGTENEYSYAVNVLPSGDILMCTSLKGTVDLDPGAAVHNVTSAGGIDMVIARLTNTGSLVWAKTMGGTQNDEAFSLALDPAGNIYATGYFQGTADFDPGVGVANLNARGGADIFVMKLNPSGNFLWAKAMGGTNYDYGLNIAADATGAYITGFFTEKVDFDPDGGTFYLTSAGDIDIPLVKLDADGNFVWATSFGSPGSDWGRTVTVDASGKVYFTGYFKGTVDFDPGPGTLNLTSAGQQDFFLAKMSQPALGAAELTKEQLNIYPNPATDRISLRFESRAMRSISIYNSIGELLLEQPANETTAEVDISAFPSGLYLVTIYSEDGIAGTRKIMKQ